MHKTRIHLVILTGMVLCLAGTAWPQNPLGDNPPVFQNIGMLDAMPRSLAEADCRVCHYSGVPDRHHLLVDQAIPPGSLVPYPDADGDGSPDTVYSCLNCHDENFSVVRNCLTCHDAGSPHHATSLAVALQCSACHGDLVDDFYDGHYIPSYPPSLVTPYRGLDGDGMENPPWPTEDLASDGSGRVVPADVTETAEGPPFFTVTFIGALGTVHTRVEPNDLSFKPAGFNNDFVIRSTHFGGQSFSVVFTAGTPLAATWDAGSQWLTVTLEPTQSALDVVNAINAATGAVDVRAELGFDGDDPVADLLPSDHYEPLGGVPPNNRGFGAGSCRYCHDPDGILDANGQPDGIIWDNRTLHHDLGLPSLVSDGAGGFMSACDVCHDRVTASEQSGPNFDLAIRYCERCHGPDSLHNIQSDSNGDGMIVIGGEDAGYGHVGRDAGPGDSDCWGCHGFGVYSARAFEGRPTIPTLYGSELVVVDAGQETTLWLGGSGFTNEADGVTYKSTVRLTAADGSSITLTPEIVDQGRMSVTIPGDTPAGNYNLQAVKDKFASNPVVISVNPEVIITNVEVGRGRVTIEGRGFGGYAAGSGTSVTARLATANGRKRASRTVTGQIVSWTDTMIVVDIAGRPKKVTVSSVYGTTTSEVGGRGKHRP